MNITSSGKCRVCGCTDLNPCLSDGGDGNPLETCAWVNAERNLCSALHCIAVTPLADLLDIQREARIA